MITVIIPTYNGEKTLANAIESIRGQVTSEKFEIIVADDRSTDRTIEIAIKYDCTILIIPRHTGGPNTGRNIGMDRAKGEFIAFLDQDDLWQPMKTSEQMNGILLCDQDMAFSLYVGSKICGVVEPNTDIYSRMKNCDYSKGGVYMSSILMRNKDIPRFTDDQLDYEWILELTRDRKCISTTPRVIRGITGHNLSHDPAYRERDYQAKIRLARGNPRVLRRINSSWARYHYKNHDMRNARRYFLKGLFDWKNVAYYFTSFSMPVSDFVIEKFNVFG